jgi:Ca-activated chloride channel family protein
MGLIASQAQQGILLVGVGVGPADAYDDSLLSEATYAGHGADVYLDGPDEADVILHQRFDEVMDVAASQVQIEVRVPVGYKIASFSPAVPSGDAGVGDVGGGAGPIAADLGPGRPMIFRITLYACKTPDMNDQIGVGVTYKPGPGAPPPIPGLVDTPITSLLQATPQQIAKASAVVAYADALSGLNADRIAYAVQLAGDASFDSDPDFADPMNGIRALLAIEQQRVP